MTGNHVNDTQKNCKFNIIIVNYQKHQHCVQIISQHLVSPIAIQLLDIIKIRFQRLLADRKKKVAHLTNNAPHLLC